MTAVRYCLIRRSVTMRRFRFCGAILVVFLAVGVSGNLCADLFRWNDVGNVRVRVPLLLLDVYLYKANVFIVHLVWVPRLFVIQCWRGFMIMTSVWGPDYCDPFIGTIVFVWPGGLAGWVLSVKAACIGFLCRGAVVGRFACNDITLFYLTGLNFVKSFLRSPIVCISTYISISSINKLRVN